MEMFMLGFIPSKSIFLSSKADELSSRMRSSHKNLDKYPIILFEFKRFNTWKLRSLKKKKNLEQPSNMLS